MKLENLILIVDRKVRQGRELKERLKEDREYLKWKENDNKYNESLLSKLKELERKNNKEKSKILYENKNIIIIKTEEKENLLINKIKFEIVGITEKEVKEIIKNYQDEK